MKPHSNVKKQFDVNNFLEKSTIKNEVIIAQREVKFMEAT